MKTRFFIIPVLFLAALFVSACNIDIGPDTDADTDIDYYARYVAVPLDGTDTGRDYEFQVSLPEYSGGFYSRGGIDEVFGPYKVGHPLWMYLDNSQTGKEPKFLVKIYVKKGESGPFALCANGYDSAEYTIVRLDGE